MLCLSVLEVKDVNVLCALSISPVEVKDVNVICALSISPGGEGYERDLLALCTYWG